MRKTVFIILILIRVIDAKGQTPEIQARAAFLKAQELYGNGDFSASIERLNNVKELLGSTNPRVEYLLCQSYMANKDAEKAEISLKKYFEMADESDQNYNAMLVMIEEIKERKEDLAIAAKIEKAKHMDENDLWEMAKSTKDTTYIHAYFRQHPKGSHLLEVTGLLAQFDTPPILKDPVAPMYPSRALTAGITSNILVLIQIDETGQPIQITYLKGHKLFTSSVSKAIQSSNYSPAIRDGKPVKAWLFKSYAFGLK
jgi:hypothetical protein